MINMNLTDAEKTEAAKDNMRLNAKSSKTAAARYQALKDMDGVVDTTDYAALDAEVAAFFAANRKYAKSKKI